MFLFAASRDVQRDVSPQLASVTSKPQRFYSLHRETYSETGDMAGKVGPADSTLVWGFYSLDRETYSVTGVSTNKERIHLVSIRCIARRTA